MTLQEAMALHKQNKIEMAEQAYQELLLQDFDNPQLLYLLGTINLQRKRVGIAANMFLRALSFKKDYFEAWNNLGNCFYIAHKENDAEQCWNEALKIQGKHDVEYADIYSNLGSLHINDGTPDQGEAYLNRALHYNPNHHDAHWNKALVLLEQGKFGEGFDEYGWGFRNKVRTERDYNNVPYWEGQPVDKIVVYGEQGMGDEVLFASMIPDLQKKCKNIIFDCHPKLERMFQASFPDVKVYGTRKDAYINWIVDEQPIDARVSIGDLGKYFRRKLEDFPKNGNGYLKASDDRVNHFKKKLDKISDKMKIGLSWVGGTHKTRNDYRSIPLLAFEPILKLNADFISLQYTPEAYLEVAEAEELLDVKIHHWPFAVTEGVRFHYNETAALIESLDLIITVNTTLHHVAGALGKETWTFTPKAKAWRYWSPDGTTTPWYPSVRLIEQREHKDWSPIIEDVAKELKERIEKNESK